MKQPRTANKNGRCTIMKFSVTITFTIIETEFGNSAYDISQQKKCGSHRITLVLVKDFLVVLPCVKTNFKNCVSNYVIQLVKSLERGSYATWALY